MNLRQKQATLESARKGCQQCGKSATIIIVWTFVDTTRSDLPVHEGHPILAFIRCAEHVDDARAQVPQAPPHIRADITEETIKPLVFLS